MQLQEIFFYTENINENKMFFTPLIRNKKNIRFNQTKCLDQYGFLKTKYGINLFEF